MTRVDPSLANVIVILAQLAIALLLAHIYFARVKLPRPPVGSYDLRDVLIMIVVVVILPPLYLRLPDGLIMALLALPFLAIVHFTLSPLVPRPIPLLLAVIVVGLDVLLTMTSIATGQPVSAALHDVLVLTAALGVANLYVQNGMRARTVALFAAALAVYDVVASVFFPTMVEFFFRVQDLPLAPIASWGEGKTTAALGLGDVIVLILWPLVAFKAFGRAGAWGGGIVGLVAIAGIFAAMSVGLVDQGLPAMVFLGPLVGAQYILLRRGREERTIADYRHGRPSGSGRIQGNLSGEAWDSVTTAVRWLRNRETAIPNRGRFVALRDGELIASGSAPGDARRASRAIAPEALPVVVRVPADGDEQRHASPPGVPPSVGEVGFDEVPLGGRPSSPSEPGTGQLPKLESGRFR